jgi:hypothetical protein
MSLEAAVKGKVAVISTPADPTDVIVILIVNQHILPTCIYLPVAEAVVSVPLSDPTVGE